MWGRKRQSGQPGCLFFWLGLQPALPAFFGVASNGSSGQPGQVRIALATGSLSDVQIMGRADHSQGHRWVGGARCSQVSEQAHHDHGNMEPGTVLCWQTVVIHWQRLPQLVQPGCSSAPALKHHHGRTPAGRRGIVVATSDDDAEVKAAACGRHRRASRAARSRGAYTLRRQVNQHGVT